MPAMYSNCIVALIQIFILGVNDRGAKGPERGVKCRSARGGKGFGEDAPSFIWGSEAMPPENVLKFYMQICTFWCFLLSFV